LAVESGIAPSVLEEEDPAYLDAMCAHLKARASAASSPDGEPDVDWDDTYGGD
jgi:hypothetical protein